MTRLLPLAALAVVACNGKDAVEDTGTPPCGVDIRETFPASDSANFYHRGLIEFHLNKADETAVASVDGVEGVSSLNERNDIVTFTPTAALAPSTSYTAALSYCTGDATFNFTTSELGTDLAGEDALDGQVYTLDLTTGRVVIPEGVGAVLQEYLDFQIMLTPSEIAGDTITMLGALADEDDGSHQSWCDPSIPFPAGELDGSYFQIGPQSTTIAVADYSVTIEGLLISGTFSPDGTWFGGGVLAGEVDTRPLVPLLFEGEDDPNAICSFLVGFGVACKNCNGDAEVPYCLDIKAIDLVGAAVDNATPLEAIDYDDSHENCEDTWVIDEATQLPVEDVDGNWTLTNESCDLAQPTE
ncbi:MAG: Ig-like domain-containing protein [Myxococcota bacterium]|nr:Ig-like domain-containing protein [Myxococcota bacterium]